MKLSKIKGIFLVLLTAIMLSALCIGLFALRDRRAYADEAAGYEGAYRNKLAFSAKRGWNNDPNGLLYVNGVWHMYYQYNWNEAEHKTELGWGHMSWGHATSTDLVHWTEKPVAIPEGQQGYAMMFSGSAVYDENNTSGFFDVDASGKVVEGQGIVAILTQPAEKQRQILAYSKDNGESFTIHGEVIGADNDGGVGDNEFRDPKAFWSEKLNKWLLAVGGGSVRMYSSDNLKEWEYLGQTGYWGECPDISRYEVDGEEKYVLIISPEDKDNSHKYNKTTRADTYYPAEYYVVGDLDEKGLFVSSEHIRRLSEGIDSYAFQSFNNSPDGKVYGVSWSASWKTCWAYEGFRQTHNGGMTALTQLDLVKEGGGYVLVRNPVEKYTDLRAADKLKEFSGKLTKGENALAGVNADVADLEVELDFNGSSASEAQLWLRVSEIEKIKLSYSVTDGLLTLDRSQSSLLAKDTALYTVPYSKHVNLKDGKLSLRILLDRAFISVFADGGRASFFSAVFPSAVSNGMSLTADGDVNVRADVYKLNGILEQPDNGLILTTNKIDAVIGKTYPVILSSFDDGFNAGDVSFTVVAGVNNVRVEQSGAIAYITPLSTDYAKISAGYKGENRDIELFIYNNGWVSDVEYTRRVGGFSYYGNDGLFLSDGGDGFRFSDKAGKNFVYSAEFTPANAKAQAAGLVFGVSDNLTSYWVASADIRDGMLKLWQPGSGELKTVDYSFETGGKFKLTVVMNDGLAKVFVNNDGAAAICCKLDGYAGGKLGLNVYNGEFKINNVRFTDNDSPEGDVFLNGYDVLKVVNLTDGNYKLKEAEYSVRGGNLTVSRDYLKTLEAGNEYVFRVVTSFTDFDFKITTDFTAVTVTPAVEKYYRDDDVTLELSGSIKVHKLLIDGKEVAFTQEAGSVKISADAIASLSTGSHSVKLYTDKGRPETTITVSEKVETVTEPTVKSNHLWLWIDLVIFLGAIIGYAAFSIISKRKKK